MAKLGLEICSGKHLSMSAPGGGHRFVRQCLLRWSQGALLPVLWGDSCTDIEKSAYGLRFFKARWSRRKCPWLLTATLNAPLQQSSNKKPYGKPSRTSLILIVMQDKRKLQ